MNKNIIYNQNYNYEEHKKIDSILQEMKGIESQFQAFQDKYDKEYDEIIEKLEMENKELEYKIQYLKEN